jgi:hypothetical protein
MADAIPDLAELCAVASPVERARLIGRIARTFGTLPTSLHRLRKEALIAARAAAGGTPVAVIAEQVGLSSARVSQLTKQVVLKGVPS